MLRLHKMISNVVLIPIISIRSIESSVDSLPLMRAIREIISSQTTRECTILLTNIESVIQFNSNFSIPRQPKLSDQIIALAKAQKWKS